MVSGNNVAVYRGRGGGGGVHPSQVEWHVWALTPAGYCQNLNNAGNILQLDELLT